MESWEVGLITLDAAFGRIKNMFQNYIWNFPSDSLEYTTERDFDFVIESLQYAISTRNFLKSIGDYLTYIF